MIRRYAAVAALLAATATPAGAAGAELAGPTCSMSSFSGTANTGYLVVVDGGPIAVTGSDEPVSVTLTCSVMAGYNGDHTRDPLAVVSATGDGVAVVPPTPVFIEDPQDVIGTCTSVTLVERDGDTTTLYHDDYGPGFSTDPTVPCGALPLCSGCGLYDQVWNAVDAAVCPVLAQAFPPDGDVDGLYACPPY